MGNAGKPMKFGASKIFGENTDTKRIHVIFKSSNADGRNPINHIPFRQCEFSVPAPCACAFQISFKNM